MASPRSPEAFRYEMSKKFQDAMQHAGLPETEVLALDSQHLQMQHLAQLLQRIQGAGENSMLTVISLQDNVLTDEACALLRDALQDTAMCPHLMTINLRTNLGITPLGHEHLKEALKDRPDLQITMDEAQLGGADGIGLETFKAGAVLTEEEQPHATPAEQWVALEAALRAGQPISAISQIMREICDAVSHEVTKEEAVEPAEAQAQGGMMVTRQVKLPPGPYCTYAVQLPQLALLNAVLDLEPAPVQTAASIKPARAVGSHRFHASALVCLLVRCACDPGHCSEVTPLVLDAVVAQGLLPRVAHLAFSLPHCSCLHTAFLDAFSGHTLPNMPQAVWAPLLQSDLGWPRAPCHLPALPPLLLEHARVALKTQHLGQRSGLTGVVIQLGRDLQLACDESPELASALRTHPEWEQLIQQNGPLARLLLEQQGTYAGGKPNSMSMHGMYEDDTLGSQIHMRALFGIREYAQMHQSLNLGASLRH